jgi:hypothetical protein
VLGDQATSARAAPGRPCDHRGGTAARPAEGDHDCGRPAPSGATDQCHVAGGGTRPTWGACAHGLDTTNEALVDGGSASVIDCLSSSQRKVASMSFMA